MAKEWRNSTVMDKVREPHWRVHTNHELIIFNISEFNNIKNSIQFLHSDGNGGGDIFVYYTSAEHLSWGYCYLNGCQF